MRPGAYVFAQKISAWRLHSATAHLLLFGRGHGLKTQQSPGLGFTGLGASAYIRKILANIGVWGLMDTTGNGLYKHYDNMLETRLGWKRWVTALMIAAWALLNAGK
jgi:hypothetical protein